MPRRFVTAAAAILLSAGTVAAFTPQAAATLKGAEVSASASSVSSELLTAMQADLGLTAEQAQARVAADDRAARTEQHLRGALGARFGGAWLAPNGERHFVAVTDAAAADAVRAAGAVPTVVTRSEKQLDTLGSTLDRKAARAPGSVTGWYVDVVTNRVVIESTAASSKSALAFAAASGVPADAVRVERVSARPTTLFDLRGGDAYFINNRGRCSIGFPVAGGFVTAGHCGGRGTSTQGANRVQQGTVQGSSFPGNDYGFVGVNANWVPRGVVNNYRGGTFAVRGSQEAANGASICRSGSTTGVFCGRIQAKNQTVRYPQGTVTGLTRTNVCAEPGDSGGSWISGTQAQGVTSGGSGNCSSGGTTFYQPVNEILSRFGLRLATS
jgi:streptogrisin C